MRFNSIFLITNDTTLAKKIAKDLWETNKSWTVISCDNCYDYEFKKYIKHNKSLVVTDGKCFSETQPNAFIKHCERDKICPIFITNKTEEYMLPHTMYTALEEIFLDSLEYVHDDRDQESYKTLIEVLKVYLW